MEKKETTIAELRQALLDYALLALTNSRDIAAATSAIHAYASLAYEPTPSLALKEVP